MRRGLIGGERQPSAAAASWGSPPGASGEIWQEGWQGGWQGGWQEGWQAGWRTSGTWSPERDRDSANRRGESEAATGRPQWSCGRLRVTATMTATGIDEDVAARVVAGASIAAGAAAGTAADTVVAGASIAAGDDAAATGAAAWAAA